MTQVDYWTPLPAPLSTPGACVKPGEAVSFHTAQVPAIDLWNFMDKFYELPLPMNGHVFPRGENALDFSHFFVCLWKRVKCHGRI